MKCKFCDSEAASHVVPYDGACLDCSVARADREYVEDEEYTVISIADCLRVYVSRRARERMDETRVEPFRARVRELANGGAKGTICETFFGIAEARHEFWARIFANDPGTHVVFVMTAEEGVDEIVLTI